MKKKIFMDAVKMANPAGIGKSTLNNKGDKMDTVLLGNLTEEQKTEVLKLLLNKLGLEVYDSAQYGEPILSLRKKD